MTIVFEKVTLIGTSGESFEAATEDATDRAAETLENLAWVEVVEQGAELAPAGNREYQVEVEIAIELTE